MKRSLLFASILFMLSPSAFAQTVSIIADTSTTENALLEIAMKRHLRAEGYTVKGGTTDGYVVMINALRLKNVAG